MINNKLPILLFVLVLMLSACSSRGPIVSEETIASLQHELNPAQPNDSMRLARGIAQAAALWTEEDGNEQDFCELVRTHWCATDSARFELFNALSRVMENCYEASDKLTVELLRPTQLTNAGEPTELDWIMSAYNPMAHFSDDMFANRLAFVTILNFPNYTLEEKNTLGRHWTRLEWAIARMGDEFTTRVPAFVNTRIAQAYADAENYIAGYNIHMGALRTEDGRRLWPEDKVLLSHWNLRDELKALYADTINGQEKQEMIYRVMQHIVRQDIPAQVINSGAYLWKPYANTVEGEANTPTNARYERILAIAQAYFEEDKYCPSAPTAIIRNFEEGVEIPAAELDSLFRALIGSPQVKEVAKIIEQRLGRSLRPYDIWYDGFKARASMDEDRLSDITRSLYPDANAFAADMPRMLTRMGFYSEDARYIAHHIAVEPARGSGHAWPCLGRNEDARLRTRIPEAGMDYKGYNIAVHEFGHCVEEVLDMYRIDYYMLHGVPNTAYTETSAFIFQQRDLQLLPENVNLPSSQAEEGDKMLVLDQFWSMYEIMGVSLVDMAVWRWLYAHPDATADQLRDETVRIAQQVWNQYYEPVLGEQDCVLLGIYSHMVNSPMYLPNYPLGHIVQYQLEEHLAKLPSQQAFAAEYERIYRLGRLTPKEWMIQAVGTPPTIDPILRAIDKIVNH